MACAFGMKACKQYFNTKYVRLPDLAHRDDKSDIAIAVIVEKAGVGSEYAVPIAKEVFDAYYNEWNVACAFEKYYTY